MARVSRDLLERSAPAAAGVVLPFPAPGKDAARASAAPSALPETPLGGERPTVHASSFRDWLRAALIASLALHALLYVAFNLSFEDGLERAAGAAASAASEGTITIPVELVVESTLPSAPAPTDATAADAEKPAPTPQELTENTPPEPDLSKIVLTMPQPPEPAPVVLPTAKEAARLALPEEAIAVPMPVERADIPEAPIEKKEDIRPPAPKQAARPPAPQKPAPSQAASPSRAAAGGSRGASGGGGNTDAGGQAAVSSYQSQVLAHLSRHRVYPPEARSQGVTGVARVTFAISRDGRVLSASLAGGSGARVLDEAALAMVHRASPFPPVPPGITQQRIVFGAPIRFDLR